MSSARYSFVAVVKTPPRWRSEDVVAKVRSMSRTSPRRRTQPKLVHQFLIVLTGTEPLVWRRIHVPAAYPSGTCTSPFRTRWGGLTITCTNLVHSMLTSGASCPLVFPPRTTSRGTQSASVGTSRSRSFSRRGSHALHASYAYRHRRRLGACPRARRDRVSGAIADVPAMCLRRSSMSTGGLRRGARLCGVPGRDRRCGPSRARVDDSVVRRCVQTRTRSIRKPSCSTIHGSAGRRPSRIKPEGGFLGSSARTQESQLLARPDRRGSTGWYRIRARYRRRTPGRVTFLARAPRSGWMAISDEARSRSSRTACGAFGRLMSHHASAARICSAARALTTISSGRLTPGRGAPRAAASSEWCRPARIVRLRRGASVPSWDRLRMSRRRRAQ